MIHLNQLKEMLQVDNAELEAMNSEKLRLMLGVLRYHVRIIERELNSRFEDNPLGNIESK